ncbi:hypothetical protein [Sphingomonas sp. ID0503]
MDIGRRDLAKRLLVEIEMLAIAAIIEIEFDGEPISIRQAD